jgi:Rieske Fe-S protein
VVVLLVGFVVSGWVVGIGAVVALLFAFLWIRDLTRGSEPAQASTVEPERRRPPRPPATVARAARTDDLTEPEVSRSVFLELSTLGIGAVIGGVLAAPVLGFAIAPAFLKQGVPQHDLGPIADYPEGQYMITTFMSDPAEGAVSRRTAFIRNNGFLGKLPSVTVLSNQCVHLGCPVQPNGQPLYTQETHLNDVTLIPVNPSGFGCPCHDSQYDTEGNRRSGPAPRALNRYSYSIVDGHLVVGAPFSVAYVVGTGARAKIHTATYAFPGEPVSGLESWLYPIQPPR